MHSRTSPLPIDLWLMFAVLLAGCGAPIPPPPVTPAGVVLPPEVELSPDEAATQYAIRNPKSAINRGSP